MNTVVQKQAEPEVFALSRVHIKASGITVWNVRSERSGHDYHVTWLNGRVSCCERADGEPCPGWRYNRKCHHAALVVAREDERRTRQNNFELAMGI